MDTGTIIMAVLPLVFISLALEIWALIDLIRRDRREVQGENKWIWVAIIVLISTIGSIVYLLAGRKPRIEGME
ncbi:PLD nuclease N-terminal domain-containing protein [Candidatus Chlorohelix sp.]|uniref:PLD nuclease N-terminal domain-containing protein n=1 Tax=Candidatus Chlorohelix sp. TaxID=3139201 RepID=UPI0030700218